MSRSRRRLRPAGFDDLGLRYALADRFLPLVVGAMAFLAALAVAGAVAAASLATHWQAGALSVITVQVPEPEAPASGGGARADAVGVLLRGAPGVLRMHRLTRTELTALLRPWLGQETQYALPLPAVFEVTLAPGRLAGSAGLAQSLTATAPGTLVEQDGAWFARLLALARSLQACAAAAVLLVAAVAAMVVAMATRSTLSARRQALDIVHGLGATDGFIASRFARRTTLLAASGALVGVALALPIVLALARLAWPFISAQASAAAPVGVDPGQTPLLPGIDLLSALPQAAWVGLLAVPLAAAAIGWATAQATVRAWLRRLP